eukprot:gnl/TRDRNA2_/TRDRNA2_198079_c0_seq1.p1 gnl/TRDRNA2_/TRDRNA2_198079_c0~~gnl/TRDRNA2_/TRDRNA2_198079_c0_seq1.p1  ORF type:complete len:236 (-),score=46.47 gnl/TRDRNA2_/TRDRNA2_198079_c0_seq1:245-901(-)
MVVYPCTSCGEEHSERNMCHKCGFGGQRDNSLCEECCTAQCDWCGEGCTQCVKKHSCCGMDLCNQCKNAHGITRLACGHKGCSHHEGCRTCKKVEEEIADRKLVQQTMPAVQSPSLKRVLESWLAGTRAPEAKRKMTSENRAEAQLRMQEHQKRKESVAAAVAESKRIMLEQRAREKAALEATKKQLADLKAAARGTRKPVDRVDSEASGSGGSGANE